MEIKDVAPLSVVRQHRRLTLPQVGPASVEACAAVAAEVEAAGLSVAGPWIFAARGLPRDTETAFDLDYCLPVAGGSDGLPALHCAAAIYEGPLTGLFSDGYAPLLAAIAAAGLRPTGDSREVYHRWEGPDSPANRVEIQIGVAPADGG
ncbi:AraC family transcriptional regulator [Caenispirillum bisanense]|uniref:AraC effector-binding domain-containing protein n=1 Tax=Caenispirillum bisanense TaxID=414052 RepID=A0A286GPY3_9PROT|nr:AraC family transcriptional regulator [Caenispirillum bisanense]SOD97562.1 hypothetical protein SAMN05421508_1077 [Caenispirillum bisanense]